MGFWRNLFQRKPSDEGSEPEDVALEDHLLSGPSEVEELEAVEEDARPEDRGLTSPPGETW
jgi:hypothetical protein